MRSQSFSWDLDERSRNVLRTLIQEHIRVGKPVGSRRLSKKFQEKLSPATLRNVMADLEEAGLLSQPHTSAGRVPTAEGYRFYVQSLARSKGLTRAEVDQIRRSLEEEGDPGDLMQKASHVLSSFSNNIGIVLAPPISRVILKHVEFLLLSDHRVLVILVSRAGLVEHRLIRLQQALTQEELDQAGRYLVINFAGRSLMEIRSELLKLMTQERALYDRLLRNVVLLGSESMGESEDRGEEDRVYLGGTSRLFQRLDSGEMDRLFSLLETLEEKRLLVRILSECLDAGETRPSVTIGLQEHIPGMSNWTLISTPFRCDRHARGGVGILGPSRMEYDRAISLVECVAGVFGQLMESN